MEKQEVIKVLREKLALWDKIIPLMTKATTVAMQKAQVMDNRDKDAKLSYQYNSKIKIKEVLSVDNEQSVQNEIDSRHSYDCTMAAKKKFSSLRVWLTLVMLVGFVITLVPHIMNFVAKDMDCYIKFAGTIGFSFNGMMVEEYGLDIEQMTAVFLAVFSMVAQALTVFFVSKAATASLKAKICTRVPHFGRSLKGLWVALSIVVGLFALVTWIVTEPIGLVSVALIVLLSLIVNASAAKLTDATISLPTPEEAERLAEARKLDAENQAANDKQRKEENEKAKKKFLDSQKKYAKQCNDEIAAYDKEIDQLTDEIAALKKQVDTELLSEKDNNYNTIEQLLNYLENGRADTLKEALYMVDMAKEREKDRETQRQIAQMQMENDRFMAQMKRDEDRRYNNELLAQQRDHNERIQREQSRHNAEVEAHNREMERELEKIKRDHNL